MATNIKSTNKCNPKFIVADIKISNDNFPNIRKTNTVFLHMATNVKRTNYSSPDAFRIHLATNFYASNNDETNYWPTYSV